MKKITFLTVLFFTVSGISVQLNAQTATMLAQEDKPTTNVIWEHDSGASQNGIRTDLSGAGSASGQVDVVGQIFRTSYAAGDTTATAFVIRTQADPALSVGQTLLLGITKDSDGNTSFTATDEVLGSWQFDVGGITPLLNGYLVLDLAGSTTPTVTLENNVYHMIQLGLLLDRPDTERLRWRRDNNNSQIVPELVTGGDALMRLNWTFDNDEPTAGLYNPATDFPLAGDNVGQTNSQTSVQSMLIIGQAPVLPPADLTTNVRGFELYH